MVYRVVSYDIGERQDEENWPQYTPYMSCDGDEDELLTEADWYLSERYEWNHWSAVDWMPKTEYRLEKRIWWSIVSKAAERFNKRRTEILSLSRAERISFTIRYKTVSVLCPARQADWKGLLRLFSWLWMSNSLGLPIPLFALFFSLFLCNRAHCVCSGPWPFNLSFCRPFPFLIGRKFDALTSEVSKLALGSLRVVSRLGSAVRR